MNINELSKQELLSILATYKMKYEMLSESLKDDLNLLESQLEVVDIYTNSANEKMKIQLLYCGFVQKVIEKIKFIDELS